MNKRDSFENSGSLREVGVGVGPHLTSQAKLAVPKLDIDIDIDILSLQVRFCEDRSG